jgi:hypothetical protein
MAKPRNKAELIAQVEHSRSELAQLLDGISEFDKCQAKTCGEWSIKDVMAHITFWERSVRRWYRDGLISTDVDAPAPGFGWDQVDQLNHSVYEKHQADPLEEVQAAFDRSFAEVSIFINSLGETGLFAEHQYAWLGDFVLIDLVLNNTVDHYQEHQKSIRAWKKGQK